MWRRCEASGIAVASRIGCEIRPLFADFVLLLRAALLVGSRDLAGFLAFGDGCESGVFAASNSAGLAGLVAAHITLAWAGDVAGVAPVRRRKEPAYNAAATVMIAKLTGRVGAA
jgi:hypothetical protein